MKVFVSWKEGHPAPGSRAVGSGLNVWNTLHVSSPLEEVPQAEGWALLSELPFIPEFLHPLVISPVWNSKGCHLEHSMVRSEGSSHCPWPSELPLLPEDSNH